MQDRLCAEQMRNLKQIIQKYVAKELVVVFVGFEKAHDSIDREALFYTLEEFWPDNKTLIRINQSQTGNKSKVKFFG